MTTSHSDHWVCLEDDEDDYVIDRFELRIKGRKPLVLNQPSFSKLFYNVQQYLHINQSQTKALLKVSVVDTPEPFTAQEHMALLHALVQQGPNKEGNSMMNQDDIDAIERED